MQAQLKELAQSEYLGNRHPDEETHYQSPKNSFVPKATLGFPSGSVGKTSPASVPDAGSIPGSGRSHGEGNGNHPSILAWRIAWTKESGFVL